MTESDERDPDDDIPEGEVADGEEQEDPPKAPNDALAGEIAAALVEAGLVGEVDSDRCEVLLASGNASPEDWQQLIEAPLFPKDDPEEDEATDSEA